MGFGAIMATVYLEETHRRDFDRLFAEWQRSRGTKFYFVRPVGPGPRGKLAYSMVPDEFVDVLRREKIPFLSK
jgi:hypothetical protein